MDVKIPDFTKVTWQLNVAIIGAVFSIFSLIYDTTYIYYGFTTFLYGLVSHIVDLLSGQVPEGRKYVWFFITQSVLLVSWALLLLQIY